MGTWHQSGIETILQCGEKYRRSYETDEEPGTSAGALQGRAVHFGVEQALGELKENGEFMRADIVGMVAQAKFYEEVKKDRETEDPIPWGEDALAERAEEVEMQGSALWEKMPYILEQWGGPQSVEFQFEDVPLNNLHPNVTLGGTWDMLSDQHKLIDWKTSDKGWRPGAEMSKLQPLVYARAVEHVTGEWPRGFLYVVVTRTGRVQLIPTPIGRERYEFLEATLPELERQREQKIYPLNPDSGLCSPVWCPWFLRGCPAAKLKGVPE
jgi:PD-(D/E)XK nuclease superfamily